MCVSKVRYEQGPSRSYIGCVCQMEDALSRFASFVSSVAFSMPVYSPRCQWKEWVVIVLAFGRGVLQLHLRASPQNDFPSILVVCVKDVKMVGGV